MNLVQVRIQLVVYDYTREVLETLRPHRIKPMCVQVGNDITNDFLWGEGHSDNLEGMVALLQSGIKVVKDFNLTIKSMLYLDYITDNTLYRD